VVFIGVLLRFSIIQFAGGFILVWMRQSCVIAFASCKGAVELLGSHLASETARPLSNRDR
jgi:hypothetical protein